MDSLVKLTLQPLGIWTTPWQADTLMGALASAWARSKGVPALYRDFLNPWNARKPLFVISNAFPGDSLPAPACLPLWWNWPEENRKEVKNTRWLSPNQFKQIQRGAQPDLPDSPGVSIQDNIRLRNSISRATDTTDDGGQLFEVPFSHLADPKSGLTLYARAKDNGLEILTEALRLLGRTGYGADASVGHGGFDLAGEPTECPELDDIPNADAFISLSTFQPAHDDPTNGLWKSFIKYGKMAPDFHHIAIFKRPQIMLEAGACFRTKSSPKPFYGTPIGPNRLLDERQDQALANKGVRPVQAAFTLAVPLTWKEEPHHA